MQRNLIVGLFMIFMGCLHFPSVTAIYCFQCNSLHDPECEVIMPNDTSSIFYRLCEPPLEAIGREMFCRKIIQTIYDRDNMVRVVRKCGWVLHEKRDCYSVVNKAHEEISCQCFSDGCNSATTLERNYYMILLTLLSLCSYFRFR